MSFSPSAAFGSKHGLFLDCDDTLYSNGFRTAEALTASIGRYCLERLGLSFDRSYELYKVHGTCLKGLEAEQIPHDRDHFLEEVHKVDLDFGEDQRLRAILSDLAHEACRVHVFTASVRTHARRCLEQLGVADLLDHPERPIIDVRSVRYMTKHHRESFETAQRIAGVGHPSLCTLVDDSWTNIKAAKAAGWRTVVCGTTSRDGRHVSELVEADHVIASIHDLPRVLPQYFRGGHAAGSRITSEEAGAAEEDSFDGEDQRIACSS